MLISGLKEHFMVLDVFVKFRSQQKSGSRDTGSKGVKNGAFRLFLEKYWYDDADFRAERTFYGTGCVCKVWEPTEIWFSIYWVRGSKTELFD